MKILLADDNEMFLNRHIRFFTGTEHDVIGVENGHMAIESARRRKPDLVITDFDMPLKDGIAVISEIKTMYPETRIWLCTSQPTPHLDSEARSAGAEKVIWKPQLFRNLVKEKIVPDNM